MDSWTKEELHKAYFHNPTNIREKINSLPGAKIDIYLKSLKFSYQLLCDSIDSLIRTTTVFRCEAQKSSIYDSGKSKLFKDLEFSIQKDIFAYSTWIYAIENYCRVNRIPNTPDKTKEDIKKKRLATFDHNEKYLFLRALRRSITHLPSIYLPHWQISWSKNGKQIKFVFDSNRLSKTRDRNDNIKSHEILLSFIHQNPIIDTEELCKQFHSSIKKFYHWLIVQIENNSPSELNEYYKYIRWLSHFNKKAFINVVRKTKKRKNKS